MTEVLEFDQAQSDLQRWLAADEEIAGVRQRLAAVLPAGTVVHLVGGALRDCLLGLSGGPKDFDLVVSGVSLGKLVDLLPGAGRNCFGGLVLADGTRSIDLWPLGSTWHIERFGLAATLSNFLLGAPFNLDKGALELGSGRLHERGLLQGLNARTIDYDPRFPYLEEVQAARCILQMRRTGFELGSRAGALLARIAPALASPGPERQEIAAFLKSAYGMHAASAQRGVIDEIRRLGRPSRKPRLAA
jgi:hypothetical protein